VAYARSSGAPPRRSNVDFMEQLRKIGHNNSTLDTRERWQ
jgi:hypothetical protein